MINQDYFITRKFKNIQQDEVIDFDMVIQNSNISVILGEPASGKTAQLKNYNSSNPNTIFIELITIDDEDNIEENIEIILLDSIDEALSKNDSDKILVKKLTKYIKRCKAINPNIKFIISCRYLEWKEIFENKLEEIDRAFQVYSIEELSEDDIDLLLIRNSVDKDNFKEFIKVNYLEQLLKNILMTIHLINNFDNYKNRELKYVDIYKEIIKEHLLAETDNERKKQLKEITLEDMLKLSSIIAIYMTLNRTRTISIEDINRLANELYSLDEVDITGGKLEIIFDTALFSGNRDSVRFFHKSVQEYLTAYFIDLEQLDIETIKKIFAHDMGFYEEFEEVIIYLTNIELHFFKYFVEFDPFIFRRHPSLSKEQQEKLLLSILKKLQNNESFAWDKKAFFYNTSLVKFNDIDVYSIIKDKNIEKSQNDILLQYIMRLFAENYAKEFEGYIFEILSQNLHDKIKCSQLIGYNYNIDYRYNLTLFNFMKKNQLFFIEDNTNIAGIGADRNINSYIIERLFLVLYGFKLQYNNHNQIIRRDDKDYDVEKVVDLLPFIKYESFVEITLDFIALNDIEVWFKQILKTYKYTKLSNYHDNIGWMLYELLNEFTLLKETMIDIIVFVQKNQVSIKPPSFQKYTQLPTSLLFYPIQNDFFEIYFSNKVQGFAEISNFIGFYHIKKIDIEEMQKKYPFEDNFFKTFQLLEYLNRQQDNNEEFLVLEEEQLDKIVSKLKYMEQNEELAEAIFTLFRFNYSKELEDLVFQILEKYTNDIEKCRKYIEETLVSNYEYNFKLFNFMKKFKLFTVKKDKIVVFDSKNKIENWLFNGLYGLWFQNEKPRFEKNNYKEEDILFLFEYISYYHFFNISKYIDIEDIEKWFYYFYEYYNSELLENNFDYKCSLGWIAYKLLIDNNLQSIPLEKIMMFFQDTNLHVKFNPSRNGLLSTSKNTYSKPPFDRIENEFWKIYFSEKIKSFKEIKNFISLYNIDKKDLKEAISKYPIEENIEKYYGLGVQYNFIDVLIDNEKASLDDAEKKYLKKVDKLKKEKQYYIDIQNVNKENFEDIFYYAVEENNDFIKTDKKLRDDLKDKYDIFISEVIKGYILLEKEYIDNQWIYNYLFNILSTQKEINNTLVMDKNYKKLFWYIVLGCISTHNDVLFDVIEEKLDLFLEVVEEFIKNISKKENTTCFDASMKWELNMGYSPCRKIIDIFKKIEFDKEQKIWIDFFKKIEKYKEKTFQYKKFFGLIEEINKEPITLETSLLCIEKNNEKSFTHFTFVFREDINLALEYFYKYIYDSIPYEKVESNTKLDDFYKDKNTSYNTVKIILFDKLLKQFRWDDYKNLDEIYIEKILIDYYKFFKEEKIPLANDYYKNYIGGGFGSQTSNAYHFIVRLWGLLQSDKKYKPLLEELKKSDNKNIADSAEYCLLKLYEKQGVERNFENEYYKEVFDNYKKEKDRFFNYEKLRDDLIEISLIETKNRNAIFKESEDETNDRFRNALHYKKYNVADQSRGGESSSGINAGERDLVVCNKQGLDESIIEAFTNKRI